ncbi:MAG: hypothetical protein J6Y97_04910 [Prevotella sp.]|nr:hypothetical protein [Prevotella sp.]
MKRIMLLLSISLIIILGGCHTKNESNKDEEQQNVTPTADSTLSASDATPTSVNDDGILDISEMPSTAKRLNNHFQYAVYTNEERVMEDFDNAIVYSIWLADERTGTVRKICETNPKAEAQWEKMSDEQADGVAVALDQIASAEKAWIAPGDVSKVIVQGCPDGRNEWTYIIDTDAKTAIQLPSTEGVASLDWEKKEIIVASYGYHSEGGRYTFLSAYDNNGKFLRMVGDKSDE